MKTERLEVRLSTEERRRLEAAADLAGVSLSALVVAAALERADEVVSDHAVTVVPAEYFDRLVESLDRAEPAHRLARAAKRSRIS